MARIIYEIGMSDCICEIATLTITIFWEAKIAECTTKCHWQYQ